MRTEKFNRSFKSIFSWALPVGVALLLVACGDDDGGPSTPAPEVSITADKTTTSGQSSWSMPTGAIVTQELPPFGFTTTTFTASNDQGQVLTINFDSLAIGTYSYQGVVQTAEIPVFMTYLEDPDGFAYNMGAMADLQQGPTNPFAMISITEINTQAKVASGTFQGLVVDPLNTSEIVFFENGVFENVPYSNVEDLEPPTDGIDDAFLSATLDGAAFDAATVIGSGTNNPAFPTVSFNGISADGTMMAFTFQMLFADLETTTYNLGSLGASVMAQLTPDAGNPANQLTSQSGTLTITSIDASNKVLEGTFEFEAAPFGIGGGEDASVTGGAFKVQILM